MTSEIKRLAEFFAESRPDIAEVLHDILDGRKWVHHKIREQTRFVHSHVIVHDGSFMKELDDTIQGWGFRNVDSVDAMEHINRLFLNNRKQIPEEIIITYDTVDDEFYAKDADTGRELDEIITKKSNWITPPW